MLYRMLISLDSIWHSYGGSAMALGGPVYRIKQWPCRLARGP